MKTKRRIKRSRSKKIRRSRRSIRRSRRTRRRSRTKRGGRKKRNSRKRRVSRKKGGIWNPFKSNKKVVECKHSDIDSLNTEYLSGPKLNGLKLNVTKKNAKRIFKNNLGSRADISHEEACFRVSPEGEVSPEDELILLGDTIFMLFLRYQGRQFENWCPNDTDCGGGGDEKQYYIEGWDEIYGGVKDVKEIKKIMEKNIPSLGDVNLDQIPDPEHKQLIEHTRKILSEPTSEEILNLVGQIKKILKETIAKYMNPEDKDVLKNIENISEYCNNRIIIALKNNDVSGGGFLVKGTVGIGKGLVRFLKYILPGLGWICVFILAFVYTAVTFLPGKLYDKITKKSPDNSDTSSNSDTSIQTGGDAGILMVLILFVIIIRAISDGISNWNLDDAGVEEKLKKLTELKDNQYNLLINKFDTYSEWIMVHDGSDAGIQAYFYKDTNNIKDKKSSRTTTIPDSIKDAKVILGSDAEARKMSMELVLQELQ